MLTIAPNLRLPLEAVTQTFTILAKRGVGKSYTASVMAEEMLKAGHTIIALDPTGAWWGLRSDYPVVIFGGEHADVPLEESAGEVIAKSIVENRFPAVLDLGLFRKGQMIRFMVAFAETLYRLNREAVHLFVDEADAFAPQARNYGGDENRMLGAMEDIVRRGRKRGIGCTLITQRPAVLNKNVLTQCEVLVALRLVHPKDIDAIEEWVNVHADPAAAKEMIDSLPSLSVGEAWFWSPGWGDIFQRVKVRHRETFDSGATPKAGEAPRRPKRMAEIDLAALGEQIKATVEKAKADDPKELRRRIAELEKKLRERPPATVEVEKVVEVPVLKNGQLDRTERITERVEALAGKLTGEVAQLRRLIAPAAAPHTVPRPTASRPNPTPRPAPAAPPAPAPVQEAAPTEGLTGSQQRILDALAWLEVVGIAPASRPQLAFLVGLRPTSGGFKNYLGSLRSSGLIDYPADGSVALTDAGRAKASPPDAPPTTEELHRQVMGLLGGSQRRILQILIDAYPSAVDRETLAAGVGLSVTSGGFKNYLGQLRTLGMVGYPSAGCVVALPVLFLE
jgi:hypothetical protein